MCFLRATQLSKTCKIGLDGGPKNELSFMKMDCLLLWKFFQPFPTKWIIGNFVAHSEVRSLLQ